MTAPESLFRREALDHHTGSPGPGEVVRFASAWTVWAYWLLLLLVLAGVAATFVVRAEVSASAPVAVDVPRRIFTAVVSAPSRDQIWIGQQVRIELDDEAGGWLAARVRRAQPADVVVARQAGFQEAREPAVLVTGAVLSPVAELPDVARVDGRASFVVGSQPAAIAFAADLGQMLGFGGRR